MPYLICRQRVADYEKWRSVFDSHAQAQRESGLEVEKVLRNMDDPDDVFALFRVTDVDRARQFVTSADVPRAQEESGVIGKPDVVLLD